MDSDAGDRPSLSTLRGTFSQLPDAGCQDYQDVKGIWETGERVLDGVSGDTAVDKGG